ncbi:MAG TPA: FtsK/SpoIIIE domain-containing protein [Solirubrobacteraceae bacterium]
MQIVLRSRDGERELDLDVRRPDATVGDVLRAALGPHAPDTIFLDDRLIDAACPVAESGLYEGGVLRPDRSRNGADARAASGDELVLVGGLRAGQAVRIGDSATIGRLSTNDVVLDAPRVSRRHCQLRRTGPGAFTVTDAGSANGTFVDGRRLHAGESAALGPGTVVEVGAVAFTVRAFELGDRPRALDARRLATAAGTLAFNRPPRAARPSAPGPLTAPDEPPEGDKPTLSVAHTVGPILVAGIMVAVSADLRFALFALLSPLIALGAHLESRRKSTKDGVASQAGFAQELADFQRGVERACALERTRRWDTTPDPAECLRRAAVPSTRLWERRPHHPDFLHLFAGVATIAWRPPLAGTQRSDAIPAAAEHALAAARLAAAPIGVDLGRGEVVGVVGDREGALAVARSLVCQAAVHHGPADVVIGVFVDPGREAAWDWAKWLPHTRRVDDGSRWLSAETAESNALLGALADRGGPTVFAVIDSDGLTQGVGAPARKLLGLAAERSDRPGGEPRSTVATGVVVARSADRLPAACTTIIEVDDHGDGTVSQPAEGTTHRGVLMAGVSVGTARRCARHLARFEDPEVERPGAELAESVRLLPLLDLETVDAAAIRRSWRRARASSSPSTPLGVTERGTFTLDLVRDGPHGLIGGTTGSGKSELLRSFVAGLAAGFDARHLTFVLMDFKGGAAFDACARLPHTVGMVTDLENPRDAMRALRALDAEVHQRERLLRAAGAANLDEHAALGTAERLPRLVVVIDEFATMAEKYPEMLKALVSIAQRGRTLGIHLVLATQRPAGVVGEDVRTNTNLRIALRVQDAQDSHDVIDRPDAAHLSRLLPGRAFIRLGPGEVVPIQTALITSSVEAGGGPAVDVRPFTFRATASPRGGGAGEDRPAAADSDLVRLVDAVIDAHAAEGHPSPRRPWPDPLPPDLDLADLLAREAPTAPADQVLVALADDPDHQSQEPTGWAPAAGNLLLIGNKGSGTTTALASIGLSLAAAYGPDDVELFVFDFGAGDLADLAALPHTGAVIAANDRERQMRLMRHLRRELDRRRAATHRRRTIVLIDNLGAMRAEFADVAGTELMDELDRVYADGPGLGLSFAVAADRPTSVPSAWSSITAQKWLFRLADAYDYTSLGLARGDVPDAVPGRGVVAESRLQIQVARPTPSIAEAAAALAPRWPPATDPIATIEPLANEVPFTALGAVAAVAESPWRLPYGVREADFGTAELVLYEGEHVLVAGPPRSGRSTTLLTLAEALRGAGSVYVAGIGSPRSPLPEAAALDRFAQAGGEASALLAELRSRQGPAVLLVDDAETVEDLDGALEALVSLRLPGLHVIAAGRADGLRSIYVGWTKVVRRSRAGVLLRPDIDMDGELLSVTLPRRSPVALLPGRGYAAVNGVPELVQVALPSP